MYIVHCTTNTIWTTSFSVPFVSYTLCRSAEVREYERVHKLVNREEETISHLVLSKDNKGLNCIYFISDSTARLLALLAFLCDEEFFSISIYNPINYIQLLQTLQIL
jgi:hypothetical protein